ncbi:preprotein translocase subunit SecE [Candidatus Roizmanbacteria bacterium RIFCSPLOWO2_01_FULL_38_12]|uniref:Protein translocase subunit SecE n=1 Tax=Candidatus Roizmanbacteria bacterium RIFCSPLOWO2_01_FULL_38_12 TaxID=1802061 RepID=A0A1F7J0K7_9BACT|nr:MAG: preprotein translocase subunit SecE [Candidatus Roizmanbacteria bacterium RIFCSPHIGHO2_01_FULL_38_15]OGK34884.1 MAG: preprotein translocase subunit SecE [Candidatus Roizmanbacteria bacterium RIFCSPHIGHO2_12_FULL_38_13]OGK49150.1 MAG: preprotein translocase subunit SecE [Candidatus Roizmanbacteria bacterium RIFCSPLOWO2_01_FULL_38_12]
MAKPIQNSKVVAGDLIGELKKVTWPSRENTIRLTIIVIAISLIIGFYIGIIDSLLAIGLEYLTNIK